MVMRCVQGAEKTFEVSNLERTLVLYLGAHTMLNTITHIIRPCINSL